MAACKVAAGVAGAGAVGMALVTPDWMHALRVLRERRMADELPASQAEIDAVRRWYAAARDAEGGESGEAAEGLLVSAEAHAEALEACGKRGPADPRAAQFLVARESVLFLGGGRAALLQLAHPFVASGVAAHSALAQGVQERFFRTFKYMFAMIFGDPQTAAAASRTVRKLHNRVRGTVPEAVGLFKAGHEYNAGHKHALLWVHVTLVDSSVLMFELCVRRLALAEKTAFLRANNEFVATMFGVPRDMLPPDWPAFERLNRAVLHSGLLGVGATASKIDGFLWRPPRLVFAPLLALVRWLSFALLPPRLGAAFYGREQTRLDELLAALLLGVVRFIYRLVPRSARFLTAYLDLERRAGARPGPLAALLARASARVATVALAFLMPPRAPQRLLAPALSAAA